VIASYVAQAIRYSARTGRDPWQFPDETLFLHSGDCEDIAFLLASLMLAAGVSGYNIRVALGRIRLSHLTGRSSEHDHMWVMYKNEAGRWMVIEPLHFASMKGKRKTADRGSPAPARLRRADYVPRFLFNQDHVWMVARDAKAGEFGKFVGRQWSRLNPKFAGEVHQSILTKALQGVAPEWVRTSLNRHFSSIFGQVVDEVDNFVTSGYDSRDHFDNGFIPEGWAAVRDRLARFKGDNQKLDDFAYAAHGIADFYAHSSYLHFAKLQSPAADDGGARPYDPADPGAGLDRTPAYDASAGFNIGVAPFSVNSRVYKGDPAAAPGLWSGKVISGRYAQKGDSHGFLEKFVNVPPELIGPDFPKRGSLPHHEEIAVDSDKREKGHRLYTASAPDKAARNAYQNQFRWRRNTAIAHIRAAFQANWNGS
jgi:hypothetical protein